MALLDAVSLKRFKALAKDDAFLGELKSVMEEFNAYMALKAERKDPSIAYFCMEYGLDTSLKIYSGGLGLLAGDYLKETSDMNVNLVAVGLLYRYGYFTQIITGQGEQVARRAGFHEDPCGAGHGCRGQMDDHECRFPWPYDHSEDLEGGSRSYRPLSA